MYHLLETPFVPADLWSARFSSPLPACQQILVDVLVELLKARRSREAACRRHFGGIDNCWTGRGSVTVCFPMGVKKLFRGGGAKPSAGAPAEAAGADHDEAASIGISSVEYSTNANYSDLVSPMKGPSFAESGTKATGKGKAGWSAGIRKRLTSKKKGSSSSESLGTSVASDSPRNAVMNPGEGPTNNVNATAAATSTTNVGRSVKFADEGSVDAPLHTTKLIESATGTTNGARVAGRARAKSVQPSPGEEYAGFPPTSLTEAEQYYRRVLIMLLSPETQEFEIVALYYDTRERTGLSNIIHKIPKVATSKCFSDKARSRMRYRGLTRVQRRTSASRRSTEPEEELISVLSLADYDIQPDEMLVAIPKGFEGRVIAPMAASLLADGRVQKLVNRIVRTNKLPPPPTLYGRIRKAIVRSKRKLKRRIGKGGIGTKLMGSFVLVLILIILAHFLAPSLSHLPAKVREIEVVFGKVIEACWE